MSYKIFVANRSKKKAAKKKPAAKKRPKAAKPAKQKAKPMAKPNPKPNPKKRRAPAKKVPAKTKRRKSNPAPKKRKGKRRKSNPSFGFGGVLTEAKNALPRLIGRLAVAWAVRRWGGTGSLWGNGVVTSPSAGVSWNWNQYMVASLVAAFGPKLFGKFVNATEFRRGAVDIIITKLVWTEGISKSQWAVQQFGTGGDIMGDNSTGQLYVNQGGSYNAMQGYGDVVEASALDGLVEANALDGPDYDEFGHLMPAGTGTQAGSYHDVGHESAYHAAYSR